MPCIRTCKTLLALAALLASAQVARAGAEEQLPWAEIKSACGRFLDTFSSAKELAAMQKKLKQQVQTKVQDRGIDEDQAMRDIMLDWAAGNQKRLETKERQAIKQACFFFVQFIEKGYQIPGQMRDRITVESAQKLIAHLEKEVAKGSALAAK